MLGTVFNASSRSRPQTYIGVLPVPRRRENSQQTAAGLRAQNDARRLSSAGFSNAETVKNLRDGVHESKHARMKDFFDLVTR